MVFKPEEYLQPRTPEEACSLLLQHGKHARIIAGGTAIYELAKRGLADEVKHLVSLKKLSLDYVRKDNQGLHVGAASTLTNLDSAEPLRDDEAMQILVEAIHEIRPLQVRTMATVGGEVCTSLPLLDLPTALLAVEAQVVVKGPNALRVIPLEDFLVDFFLNTLQRGEFMIEALIPPQPSRCGAAFMKFGRTAYDFNLVNVAVRVSLDKNSVCSDARIFLGGVGRVPHRAAPSERELTGSTINDESIGRAVRALGDFKVLPQIHGDAEYKREVAKVLLRDSLKRASGRIPGVASHD